jgi:hypothetical protein
MAGMVQPSGRSVSVGHHPGFAEIVTGRINLVRHGGLRPRLDHGDGNRRASGRDRSAGFFELVEPVEIPMETAFEVGLIALNPVEVLRIAKAAGESPPFQGLLVAAGQVLVRGLAVVGE